MAVDTLPETWTAEEQVPLEIDPSAAQNVNTTTSYQERRTGMVVYAAAAVGLVLLGGISYLAGYQHGGDAGGAAAATLTDGSYLVWLKLVGRM